MGKSTTPKYRLEIYEGQHQESQSWNSRYGRPSNSNLEKYILGYVESLKPGGVNYGVTKMLGHIPVPSSAKIVNQKTGQVAASWKAPMFWVVDNPKRSGNVEWVVPPKAQAMITGVAYAKLGCGYTTLVYPDNTEETVKIDLLGKNLEWFDLVSAVKGKRKVGRPNPKFYAYIPRKGYFHKEHPKTGDAPMGTGNQTMFNLKTVDGAHRRAECFFGDKPYKLFTYSNFFDENTFRQVNPVKKLPVIFRKYRGAVGMVGSGDIIALFPTIPASMSPYECQSYMNIGQHDAADPVSVINMTNPAKPSEYAPLLKELHKVGYRNLDIKQRYDNRYLEIRRKELAKTARNW